MARTARATKALLRPMAGVLLVALSAPAALAGCGQKGPLTLPAASPAASAPASR